MTVAVPSGVRKCAGCGVDFQATTSRGGRPRKRCDACLGERGIASRDRSRDRSSVRRSVASSIDLAHSCVRCGLALGLVHLETRTITPRVTVCRDCLALERAWCCDCSAEIRTPSTSGGAMRCESCAAAQENARNRVRMARRRTAAPGDLTTAEVRELLDAAAACPICGVEMDDTGRGSASKSIDHVVPVSQGGENTLSNVRVVCFGCNARAGLRLREEASA